MDVSQDGSVCAVVDKSNLSIYDVCSNSLTYSLKNISASDTKSIKISPSNNEVAWLQSSSKLILIHIDSKRTHELGHDPDHQYTCVMWSPDGKYLAAFSCLSIFIDVYKIEQDSYLHSSISGTKLDEPPIAHFSPDSNYFATVNICKQGHCFTIYCTSSWDCIQRLYDSVCYDIGGLLWCADSASLLVWQTRLDLRLRLWTLDGRTEHQLTAASAPIRTVCLSSCGRTAVVHSADTRLQVLDLLTWQLSSRVELVHHPVITKTSARSILRESPVQKQQLNYCEPILERYFELSRADVVKHDALAQLSSETRYLASYEPVYPHAVWVWDLTADAPLQTVILLTKKTYVKGFLWHEERAMLAATLADNRVLVWTAERCVTISHDKSWPLTAHTYFATLQHSQND